MKTEKQMAAPTDYIKKMKKRDPELSKGWGQIVTPLSVQTARGKQKVNCAPREGIFRIIQAIPSPIYDRCQSLVNTGTPYDYKTRKVTYFFKPIKGYKKRK